jgi:hypothetical protein
MLKSLIKGFSNERLIKKISKKWRDNLSFEKMWPLFQCPP